MQIDEIDSTLSFFNIVCMESRTWEKQLCMFEKLLAFMARRQCNENALSDITWAACSACPSLFRAFLAFFFPETEFGRDILFEREHAQGDSRPDFYIRDGAQVYLVENKIYDRNHHFDQYTSRFGIPAEHLGYITNYPMVQVGFKVHTWDEFYHYLKDRLPEDSELKQVWCAYMEYIKQVCSIYKKPKRMELKGMYSLYVFCRELRGTVNRQTASYCSELYDSYKDTHGGGNVYGTMRDGIAGCYFHVRYTNDEIEECWPWIGVYFDREEPLICICFEPNQGWGKSVCDRLTKEKVKALPAGDFYEKPYYEDGGLWFELSEVRRKEFENADLNGQNALLGAFIDEVINTTLK